jgi:hypothetical protein
MTAFIRFSLIKELFSQIEKIRNVQMLVRRRLISLDFSTVHIDPDLCDDGMQTESNPECRSEKSLGSQTKKHKG